MRFLKFEVKIVLILSAVFLALVSLNLYLQVKNRVHLKLIESSVTQGN